MFPNVKVPAGTTRQSVMATSGGDPEPPGESGPRSSIFPQDAGTTAGSQVGFGVGVGDGVGGKPSSMDATGGESAADCSTDICTESLAESLVPQAERLTTTSARKWDFMEGAIS